MKPPGPEDGVLFRERELEFGEFSGLRGAFSHSTSSFPLICEVGLHLDKGFKLIKLLHSLEELVRERSGAGHITGGIFRNGDASLFFVYCIGLN